MSEKSRNRMADLASRDYARRTKSSRDLHEIFEQPADASAPELIHMAFAVPRPKRKARERNLIAARAVTLASREHESLAKFAATAQLEVMRLRSIFANFVKCSYAKDKAYKVTLAIHKQLLPIMHAKALGRDGANAKLSNDPKAPAMAAIRKEYDRWGRREVKYKNASDFAKKMYEIHGHVVKNEGSIKNAVTRWRKDNKSSR